MTPAADDAVRVELNEHDGAPHWCHDAVVLGSDVAGARLGVPARAVRERPRAVVDSAADTVGRITAEHRVTALLDRGALWLDVLPRLP